MNLGENIYHYRLKKNLSQGALADELNVSRQSISKWENNAAVPELDKLVRMAALFDITLDALVFENTALPSTDENCWNKRTVIGLILFIFGLIGFLLSVFWGNKLYVGEEVGEIVSISIVMLSIAMLCTHNFKIFGLFAVISFLYSVVSFGFLHSANWQNYLFVSLTNAILLIWFIIMGTHATRGGEIKWSK